LRFTPSDIYQHTFKKAFRGLDQSDVEDFLDQIAEEYEMLFNENTTLKQQVEAIETRLRQTANPDAVNEMIQEAKEKINQRLEDAAEEAETIIQGAKEEAAEEAQKIIQEAKNSVRDSRPQGADAQLAIEKIDEATRDADKIIQDANKRAEETIQQAKMKADSINQEAERKTLEIDAKNQELDSLENLARKAKDDAAKIILDAEEEAEMIINIAKDQVPQVKTESTEDFEYPMFKDTDPILMEVKAKAYNVVEKAKMDEMESKLEIARLKNQKDRYLMGYRELLNKHLKSISDEADE
jgi:DivIVA domain-containing protein